MYENWRSVVKPSTAHGVHVLASGPAYVPRAQGVQLVPFLIEPFRQAARINTQQITE